MIKLNNKGFAISTILYGLLVVLILIISLLMSTMSFTRTNSKKFVDGIKTILEKRVPLNTNTPSINSSDIMQSDLDSFRSVNCSQSSSAFRTSTFVISANGYNIISNNVDKTNVYAFVGGSSGVQKLDTTVSFDGVVGSPQTGIYTKIVVKITWKCSYNTGNVVIYVPANFFNGYAEYKNIETGLVLN